MPLSFRDKEPPPAQGWLSALTSPPLSKKGLSYWVAGFGGYALAGGLITLLGWMTGMSRLTNWEANGISMKANAAIASSVAGAALIGLGLRPTLVRSIRTLSLGVILLGGLTLLEHLAQFNLGIDTLLFDEAPGARATSAPGRMGIPASTSFVLLGVAMVCLTAGPRARKWSVRLGVIALAIATLSLTGYFYGADAMFSIPRWTGIAAQTASMILSLALGVIACVPERDPVRVAMERGSAGVLIRRAVPVVVAVPFILGWLRVWIQEKGWVDTAFGAALRTITEVGLLVVLLWSAARSVRRHERALFENRELLRTTLMSIGDGVITTDPQGKVTYLNAVAESLTGWRRSEAKGEPLPEVFKLLHETTRQSALQPASSLLDLGTPTPRSLADQTVLVSRTGTERLVDDTAAPIKDEDGRTIGCVLIFRDTTSRRAAERDLRARTEELERRVKERTLELQNSNEQLEAFVYSIAHDLRAPLRTMASFSQLVVEDHAQGLDETGRDYLRRIREGSEFMDRLLLDLLAYGRVSKAEMELENVAVQKVLETACTQLNAQIRETGAVIEVHGLLPLVRAHEATLGQCLTNLLNNSMKFVSPGVSPRITISVEPIPITAQNSVGLPRTVRVWLCDNGIGIAPEHQERAFRVFERLQGGRYPGTGIGLSIVRKGIERMGGRVGIESSIGKGCRFWMELIQAL